MDRVLDVRQGELCWVAGTVYMDMLLKPNILDDLTKEVGIIPSIGLTFLTPMPELHLRAPSAPHICRSFRSVVDPDHVGG